jgi:hypothetical protein
VLSISNQYSTHDRNLLKNYVIDSQALDAGLWMGASCPAAQKKTGPGRAGENAFEGAGIEETVPD